MGLNTLVSFGSVLCTALYVSVGVGITHTRIRMILKRKCHKIKLNNVGCIFSKVHILMNLLWVNFYACGPPTGLK